MDILNKTVIGNNSIDISFSFAYIYATAVAVLVVMTAAFFITLITKYHLHLIIQH